MLTDGDLQRDLFGAIGNRDAADIVRLLRAGAKVDLPGDSGWTPLMIAAEHGMNEIVELLLLHGANPNAPGSNGDTPLHVAVDIAIDGTLQLGLGEDSIPTIAMTRLLEAGADIYACNSRGESPLDWAKRYNCTKVTTLLMQFEK